jgi:Tol biopolymer transport system component
MPLITGQEGTKKYYSWGKDGKKYYYNTDTGRKLAKKRALKQGVAISYSEGKPFSPH